MAFIFINNIFLLLFYIQVFPNGITKFITLVFMIIHINLKILKKGIKKIFVIKSLKNPNEIK